MTIKTPTSRFSSAVVAVFTLGLAVGCSSSDGEDTSPGPEGLECADSEIEEGGECVLNPFRFEPDNQLDQDNIVYYGNQDLVLLADMPPPPKSGFRLVMEPQDLPAGYDSESESVGMTDVSPCQSWEVPDLANRWVYTSVVHTSPGLHHANLYGLQVDPAEGPQPYPNCRQSADARVFGQITRYLGGTPASELVSPVVLFANSTQVIGVSAERYALADGYAFEVAESLEISANTHLQNTTPDNLRVEAAWDFYTMPADQVVNPAAMFVYIHFGFLLPARSQKSIHGNCEWKGGDVLGIMPHTHQWATGFKADFGTAPLREYDSIPEPGFDQFTTMAAAYDRAGTGLADSDIEMYNPALSTAGANAVQFQCEFNNTTDHEMRFGVGENEMCFLFGYTSPPEARTVGLMIDEQASCITIGGDGRNVFNMGEWLGTQSAEAVAGISGRASNGGFGL